MFRHNKSKKNLKNGEGKGDIKEVEGKKVKTEKDMESPAVAEVVKVKADKEDGIRELLEKNLKWSQIIYEQNRKIKRRMTLAAVAGWLRLLLIVTPIILALLFLPPLLKDVYKSYSSLTGVISGQSTIQEGVENTGNSLDSLMKILNLTPEQKGQVNNLVK